MKATLSTENGKPVNLADDSYLTKPELAARLRMQPRTIQRWMKLRIIPFIKLGDGRRATVLFKWSDVDEHLNRHFRVCGRGGK